MNRFYFILPLIFLCTIFTAQTRKMELWPAHTFRVKLNKQFKIDVENQLRANISTGDLNQFFTQSSIKYKSKKTRLSSGFRLIQEFNNPIENHLRYHIDYSFGSDISFRIRYQTKNQLGIKKIEGDYFDNDLRYRLKMKINVPDTKFKSSVALEFFQHFETGALNGFNKYRWTFSGEYRISKKGKIGLNIIREKQWVYWNPRTTWVAVPYYISYIKKKKSKKENNPF